MIAPTMTWMMPKTRVAVPTDFTIFTAIFFGFDDFGFEK